MNTSIKKYTLPAPFVPSAAPSDGLLKTEDLEKPVKVEITLWVGIRPGITVQLVLDDDLVGSVWTMAETDKVGDVISMDLDPDLLPRDGSYQLRYRGYNHNSEVGDLSETTQILVDRAAPGAVLLAQAVVANINLGDHLNSKIPGYAGMEPGDIIQTVCNGTHGPAYRIHPENLTTLPIEIAFTREFLEGLFSDKINITYHVTDRAGNRSILAQSVELTLQR